MEIIKITHNKKQFLDLLLLGDEQENMIDAYLERGEMFVLNENEVMAECVVTKEADGVYELKNIAVYPQYQKQGYAKKLIQFLFDHYSNCQMMYVGTGAETSTVSFYEKCGFKKSHVVKNFFIDNYDHPIFEDGKQLIDMAYLKWTRHK